MTFRNRPKSRLSLARSLLGHFAFALAACTGGVAQTPADPVLEAQRLARVAQTAQQEGRYDDALHAYQTITVIAADSPKIAALAHFSAGNVYLTLKKYNEAANSYQRSVSLDPGSAEAYNNLGESLGELKRYAQAIGAFQQAVVLDNNLLIARFNMGLTYGRMGQPKYAEFVFKILVRDHPEYALGYDGLAVTLSKSGRASEAIQFHEKAISLNPEDPFFRYNLGISYLVLGDTARAQEQLEKLRQLNPQMAERLAAMIAKRQR